MPSNLTKAVLNGKLMFPSEYLAAIEFPTNADGSRRDVALTIRSVLVEELKMRGGAKERKPVLQFNGTKKKLVLNKTNAGTIADLHGCQAEEWVGKQITLYPTRTQCGRDTVDCIRVRDTRPKNVTAEVPFDEPDPREDEEPDAFGSPAPTNTDHSSPVSTPGSGSAENTDERGEGNQEERGDESQVETGCPDAIRKNFKLLDPILRDTGPDWAVPTKRAKVVELFKPASWEKIDPALQDSIYLSLKDGSFKFN